ncbi:MAG TPA: endolytic transglycosylase MltG [Actinomycetota bacterium]
MPPQRSARLSRRRRLRGVAIFLFFVLLFGGGGAAIFGYYTWATGASGPQRPVSLVIPKGATGAEVGKLLEDKGVIRSALAFRLLLKLRRITTGFDAGKYTNLTTNMEIQKVLDALKKGPKIVSVSVTFPEGYTVEQTAARAAHGLKQVSEKQFIDLATSGKFSAPPYLPAGTKTVEGFLYPNTYDFVKNVKAKTVIDRLLAAFKEEVANLPWERAKGFGVTPYEVVTVASLIEQEARFPPDRPKIARVIYNRLKNGMPLQIDATIQYAKGSFKPILLKDREIESPYNTYLHNGLPPTPIGSPGKSSLRAALFPAAGDWLYYLLVDCKTGRHYFTASLSDFNRKHASAPSC